MVENARVIGIAETPIDLQKAFKRKNNPQRLFQYVLATPFDMGTGRRIAVLRVDVMYNQGDPTLNRFYNFNSIEIGAFSNSETSAFEADSKLEVAPAITIADMVGAVNPSIVGNHIQVAQSGMFSAERREYDRITADELTQQIAGQMPGKPRPEQKPAAFPWRKSSAGMPSASVYAASRRHGR